MAIIKLYEMALEGFIVDILAYCMIQNFGNNVKLLVQF